MYIVPAQQQKNITIIIVMGIASPPFSSSGAGG